MCDWGALELRRYRRNEARLLAGLLRPETRAKLRAAALSPQDRALLECFWTLRRFEVAALRWADLDLPRGIVYVHQGKGRKASWTLLAAPTREALAVWFEAAGRPTGSVPVFPSPGSGHFHEGAGQPYKPGSLGRHVQLLLTRLGVWERGLELAHRFRRTFATEFLRANPGDLEGLRKLMRHDNLATTVLYVYLQPEDLASRMEQVAL